MGIWVALEGGKWRWRLPVALLPGGQALPLRRAAPVPCPHSLPWAHRRRGDVGGLQVDGVDGDKVYKQRVLPCTLDKATQDLVSLIFSSDMFRDAMQTMNIGRR